MGLFICKTVLTIDKFNNIQQAIYGIFAYSPQLNFELAQVKSIQNQLSYLSTFLIII